MINSWEPGRADTTRAHHIAAELGVWFGGLDPVCTVDRHRLDERIMTSVGQGGEHVPGTVRRIGEQLGGNFVFAGETAQTVPGVTGGNSQGSMHGSQVKSVAGFAVAHAPVVGPA